MVRFFLLLLFPKQTKYGQYGGNFAILIFNKDKILFRFFTRLTKIKLKYFPCVQCNSKNKKIKAKTKIKIKPTEGNTYHEKMYTPNLVFCISNAIR